MCTRSGHSVIAKQSAVSSKEERVTLQENGCFVADRCIDDDDDDASTNVAHRNARNSVAALVQAEVDGDEVLKHTAQEGRSLEHSRCSSVPRGRSCVHR